MDSSRIAVKLDNLRMDPWRAMEVLAEWGVGGVHIHARGEFAPEVMSKQARRKLVKHVRSLGLEISAIVLWGGQVNLCEEDGWEKNVRWGESLLELAADLECGIWGGHVGVMPWEPRGPHWDNMVRAMERFTQKGDEVDACVAIETGPEPPFVLRNLIEQVGSERIRVNYDPANLIMWPAILARREGKPYAREQALADFMPNDGPRVVGQYIVHTHAKDGIVQEDGTHLEVPLGEGWVAWPRYLQNLADAGYEGYFAIEREVGEDPVGDVRRAVDFLRAL